MKSTGMRGLLTVFLCAMTLGACSAPRAGGLINNLEALEEGHYVDKSRVDAQALQLADVSSIVLGGTDTSRVSDQKGISTQEGAVSLRSGLMGSSLAPEVLGLDGSGGDGRLDLAITEMSTGDALARVIAGELGAGHAWVQVDARVVDIDSGQLLAEFSDRRRGSGAIGLRDTFGSSGPALVREMLEGAGRDLRKELQLLFLGE